LRRWTLKQDGCLKFEEQDFILPDGEPMSIMEIVDLLNADSRATPPKRKYKTSKPLAVPTLASVSSDSDISVNLTEIPAMDILSLIEEEWAKYRDLSSCSLILGWDLGLALQSQLLNLNRYSELNTDGRHAYTFMGLKILHSNTKGVLEFVFDNPHQAARGV
jgi:hypothetical protein